MDNSSKNKVIAKNTVALYFRMILATGVALYASRVILEVLGIDDFGIYNVVGGIVVLLSFLQTALANSIQRFLSYHATDISRPEKQQEIYSSSFYTIAIMAVAVFVFCETVGLWLVNNILNIPPDRMADANIVYQISIATTLIIIFRSPFDGLIVAHERMSFFALTSIIESGLKLLIIFLLYYLPGNKLITYALLVMGVAIVLDLTFYAYTRRKLGHVRPNFRKDSATVREILSFSGWNAVGGAALAGYQQGVNIIVNVFFGVALNATMGITNQVKMAAFLLSTNLTVAANPQITKSYATGDYNYMSSLIYNVSKYAYFLIFAVGTFLILNMDLILSLWLVETPPYCSAFCCLVLVFCMTDCLLGPLWTAAMAEGHIRNYQIVSGLILLSNLPVIYLFLKFGGAPWWAIGAQIGINICLLVYRVGYLVRLQLLSATEYVSKVAWRIVAVTVLMLPVCEIIRRTTDGFGRVAASCLSTVVIMPAVIYLAGLSRNERTKLRGIVCKVLKKTGNG